MSRTFAKQSYSQQLAQRLEGLIRQGTWPAGQKIPSIRKVAHQYEVSVRTAHLALRDLEGRGLVARRTSGRGYISQCSAPQDDAPSDLAHIAMIGARNPDAKPDEWATRIYMGAEAELLENNNFYMTRLRYTEQNPDQNLHQLCEQVERLSPQLAGAIIFQNLPPIVLTLMEKLDRLGLPWVSINHPNEQVIHNFVSADNIASGRMAGRCFLENGFERIVILGMNLGHSLSQMHKATGLIQAYLLAEKPIAGIEYVRSAAAGEEFGYQAMMSYLRRGRRPPQGIFTAGDLLALGAIRALRENGLSVPGDVSVIGSTGMDVGIYSTPSLTVVPQPMEEMGRTAARMLLRMIQTGERRLPGKQIDGGLTLRDSLKLSDNARRALMEEGILQAASALAGPARLAAKNSRVR
jgi:LacI family transcriptional regulator